MKTLFTTPVLAHAVLFGFLTLASVGSAPEAAAEGFFLTPSVGVGYNSEQQSYYRIGLDVGAFYDENIYFGLGAYYQFGQHPEDDREIGGGPFVGYIYRLFSFLSLEGREDIDYVDLRQPILMSTGSYTYMPEYGIESFTYGGVKLHFTPNFGVSAGYRLALGLSNSSLSDGRSGFVFGIILGF
jgi:hypothetical protein